VRCYFRDDDDDEDGADDDDDDDDDDGTDVACTRLPLQIQKITSCPRDTVIFSFRHLRHSIPSESLRTSLRYLPERRKRIEFVYFAEEVVTINFCTNADF